MGDTDKDEQLRRAVFAAADGLLAQGVRPTLAQIEAQVLGPRHRVIAMLEEWARRLQDRSGLDSEAEAPVLERTLPGRTSSRDYAAKMVEAAVAAEQEARKTRAVERRVQDRAELDREIARASEQLRRLEERQKNEPFNQVVSNSILKTRARLTVMEARRKELS